VAGAFDGTGPRAGASDDAVVAGASNGTGPVAGASGVAVVAGASDGTGPTAAARGHVANLEGVGDGVCWVAAVSSVAATTAGVPLTVPGGFQWGNALLFVTLLVPVAVLSATARVSSCHYDLGGWVSSLRGCPFFIFRFLFLVLQCGRLGPSGPSAPLLSAFPLLCGISVKSIRGHLGSSG
jgi:hypothetical protein